MTQPPCGTLVFADLRAFSFVASRTVGVRATAILPAMAADLIDQKVAVILMQGPSGRSQNLGMRVSTKCNAQINLRAMVRNVSPWLRLECNFGKPNGRRFVSHCHTGNLKG